MSQFIITIPDVATIPSFLDSLAERDEYSEFIDNHRGVLIGFLDQVFDQLAFSGQEICPSEESQQCPKMDPVDDELARLSESYDTNIHSAVPYYLDSAEMVEQYRTQYGNTIADAYDTERALERIQS